MRRRFRRRLPTAIVLALVCGGFFAAIDWMGYTGYYWRTRGIIQYRRPDEVFWDFVVIAGFIFVFSLLWPFRVTSSGGSLDDS